MVLSYVEFLCNLISSIKLKYITCRFGHFLQWKGIVCFSKWYIFVMNSTQYKCTL